jgi:hypothetical protein
MVTATKTRKRRAAAVRRRRSGGGGLGFGFGAPGRRISGGDPAVVARGRRGGGLADGQVLLAAAHIRRQLRAGAAGCYTVAQSRWLPFIGDEIRDC